MDLIQNWQGRTSARFVKDQKKIVVLKETVRDPIIKKWGEISPKRSVPSLDPQVSHLEFFLLYLPQL